MEILLKDEKGTKEGKEVRTKVHNIKKYVCIALLFGVLAYENRHLRADAFALAAQVQLNGTDTENGTVVPVVSDSLQQDQVAYSIIVDKTTRTAVVPVSISQSGWLQLRLYNQTQVATGSGINGVQVGISLNEQGQQSLQEYQNTALSGEGAQLFCYSTPVTAQQVLYLQIRIGEEIQTDGDAFVLQLFADEVSGENRQLKEENTLISSYQNTDKILYYFDAAKDGALLVSPTYIEGCTGELEMCLYNVKGKKLGKTYATPIDKNTKVFYAVKKGSYLLAVKNVQGLYQLQYHLLGVDDKSGKTQKHAKKIAIGATGIRGVIPVTDSKKKYDWYRFYLPKAQKVKFSISGSTSPKTKIQMEIIPPNRDHKGKRVVFHKDPVFSISGINVKKTAKAKSVWPAGTWYVKINKTSQSGSGIYALKIIK